MAIYHAVGAAAALPAHQATLSDFGSDGLADATVGHEINSSQGLQSDGASRFQVVEWIPGSGIACIEYTHLSTDGSARTEYAGYVDSFGPDVLGKTVWHRFSIIPENLQVTQTGGADEIVLGQVHHDPNLGHPAFHVHLDRVGGRLRLRATVFSVEDGATSFTIADFGTSVTTMPVERWDFRWRTFYSRQADGTISFDYRRAAVLTDYSGAWVHSFDFTGITAGTDVAAQRGFVYVKGHTYRPGTRTGNATVRSRNQYVADTFEEIDDTVYLLASGGTTPPPPPATTPPAYIPGILGQSDITDGVTGFNSTSAGSKRGSAFQLPNDGDDRDLADPVVYLRDDDPSTAGACRIAAYHVGATPEAPTTLIGVTADFTAQDGATALRQLTWSGGKPRVTADGGYVFFALHTETAGKWSYGYFDNHPTRSLVYQASGADTFTGGSSDPFGTIGGTVTGREMVIYAELLSVVTGSPLSMGFGVSGAADFAPALEAAGATDVDQTRVWIELEYVTRIVPHAVAWEHSKFSDARLRRVIYQNGSGEWVPDPDNP